ncbi:type VI secretion system accessory protein TagJ [Fulvimarina sp. MAC8]|uniref:type VI secretion system accessory protein TagJ n=1 Tax=Fulvimarina sp. MAC8 TaxID=3162874 RepID=UPI0032ED824E
MTLAEAISELLAEDRLGEAVNRTSERVRAVPSDSSARGLLIDLLVLDRDYERADKQCSLAAKLSSEDAVGFSRLRSELRGLEAREAFFESGAVPSFPGLPSECDSAALRLSVAEREGNREEATAALATLEEARGQRPFLINGNAAEDWRDLDDRIPHVLEAITSSGAYLWVDYARIASVTFSSSKRPRDLALRPARLELLDGSVGEVLVPALYPGAAASEAMKLGRETIWEETASGITIGRGQRCFLAGEALAAIHDVAAIENAAVAETAPQQAMQAEVADGD